MKITRENDELVVRIPLKQNQYNHYESDDAVGVTDNLIGVIAGQEYSLSQLIDLSYKDDQQEGSPILCFDSREELEKVCDENKIQIWRHPVCTHESCHRALRGTFTYGDKGVECCEHKVDNSNAM